MARKPKHGGENTKDVTMTLPPKAIAGLDQMAGELKVSRSELVARIGLGAIPLDRTYLSGES